MRTRRGRYARKRRATFKTRVQRVLMKKAETKKYQFAEENVQCYHNVRNDFNTIYNIWADIDKGTSSHARIGDRITPRGMSLKIYLANKADRPNTMVRVIIARVPKAINGTATTYNNVDPWDQIQLGSNGNKILFALDKDRGIKALYDKVHRMPTNQYAGNQSGLWSTRECTKVVKLWLRPRKSRDIVYDSTNSNQIVNNPIIMWVIPYEQYSTLETDQVCTVAYQGTIYYKDV